MSLWTAIGDAQCQARQCILDHLIVGEQLFGHLTAHDYEDEVARDPRVDALRAKMEVHEDPTFTQEYYAADKRYIGNAVQVFFKDGSATRRVAVDFPIGHRKRRGEGMPLLMRKFEISVAAPFDVVRARRIVDRCADRATLEQLRVDEFVTLLVK